MTGAPAPLGPQDHILKLVWRVEHLRSWLGSSAEVRLAPIFEPYGWR